VQSHTDRVIILSTVAPDQLSNVATWVRAVESWTVGGRSSRTIWKPSWCNGTVIHWRTTADRSIWKELS